VKTFAQFIEEDATTYWNPQPVIQQQNIQNIKPIVKKFTDNLVGNLVTKLNRHLSPKQIEDVMNMIRAELQNSEQNYNPDHNLATDIDDLFRAGQQQNTNRQASTPN
jgi:hypothetical protein